MSHADSKPSSQSLANLTISIEPDIHLPHSERAHLSQCLSNLLQICHTPLVLNCTLHSLASFSNATSVNRESMPINHYLRVRQPRKFYWMRNIKQMYLHLRLPSNQAEHVTATLIEFHSCKRLSYSARTLVHQIKPVLLAYDVEEHSLKLNLRGENCLLQLIFSSHVDQIDQLQKGMYYKWSDEGHIRSTTIQFDVDYRVERESLVLSNTMDLLNQG